MKPIFAIAFVMLLMVASQGCATKSYFENTRMPASHTRPGVCYSSVVLDPRAGPALNSGEDLSFSEKVRMSIPFVGFLLTPTHAIDSAAGVTESEYIFYHNTESLVGEQDFGMIRLLLEEKKLTQSQFDAYMAFALGPGSNPHARVIEHAIAGNTFTGSDQSHLFWLTHWSETSGPKKETVVSLVDQNSEKESQLKTFFVKSHQNYGNFHLPPNYYLTAEHYNWMDREQVDRDLKLRFWKIYSWIFDAKKILKKLGTVDDPSELKKQAVEKLLIRLNLGDEYNGE